MNEINTPLNEAMNENELRDVIDTMLVLHYGGIKISGNLPMLELRQKIITAFGCKDALLKRAFELISVSHPHFLPSQDQNCKDRNTPEYCLFVQWLNDAKQELKK